MINKGSKVNIICLLAGHKWEHQRYYKPSIFNTIDYREDCRRCGKVRVKCIQVAPAPNVCKICGGALGSHASQCPNDTLHDILHRNK